MKRNTLDVFAFALFVLGTLARTPPWKSPPYRSEGPSPSRTKRSSQCYGELGCFSNEFPFNNSENALPLQPEFIKTRFLLFSTVNERFPRILDRKDGASLRRTRYNGNLKTKFIIHGFEQNGMISWTREIARRLLVKEPTNVIVVDWGHGSGWPYTQAVANTRVVGAVVAKMVEFLVRETSGDISKFHLIGHSLGAHVAGYAGELLTGLGRITGLDPAEPNYKGTDPRVRLDPNDATFVDVIHTDGSPFDEISGYGLIDPIGDIDFYPNGGENQPGCTRENLINIFSQTYEHGIIQTTDFISCSHSRSIELFTESILSDCQFQAYPCDSFNDFTRAKCLSCDGQPCPIMGINADKYECSTVKPRGKFYLTTGKESPFCGVSYGLEVQLSQTMPATEGLLEMSFSGSNGLIANHTLYRQEFTAGQRYTDLLLSSDHSDINSVTVRFTENSRLWSWIWNGSIQLHKIVVRDGQNDQRFCFHGNDMTIVSGQRITLAKSLTTC